MVLCNTDFHEKHKTKKLIQLLLMLASHTFIGLVTKSRRSKWDTFNRVKYIGQSGRYDGRLR